MAGDKLTRRHYFSRKSMIIIGCLALVLTSKGQEMETSVEPIRSVGQCFHRPGIPKISFSCEDGSVIKILRAFHGLRGGDANGQGHGQGQGHGRHNHNHHHHHHQHRQLDGRCDHDTRSDSALCSFCQGDCTDDSINEVYDWSSCVGLNACIRTVMQSYVPYCSGIDKFSHYLQVEYQCTEERNLIDICETQQLKWPSGGVEVTTPGYPGNYPPDMECTCKVTTEDAPWTRFQLVFFDLFFETKNGRCGADWFMVEHGEERHRHCGLISGGQNNLTLFSSSIVLAFHSDSSDGDPIHRTAPQTFRGFWIKVTAANSTSLNIQCGRTPGINSGGQTDGQLDSNSATTPSVVTPLPTTEGNSEQRHQLFGSTSLSGGSPFDDRLVLAPEVAARRDNETNSQDTNLSGPNPEDSSNRDVLLEKRIVEPHDDQSSPVGYGEQRTSVTSDTPNEFRSDFLEVGGLEETTKNRSPSTFLPHFTALFFISFLTFC